MKTPEEIVTLIRKRLEGSWSHMVEFEIASAVNRSGQQDCCNGSHWSKPLPLGRISSTDADEDFSAVMASVSQWRAWAAEHEVELVWEQRRLRHTPQQVPTHVHVATLDKAAHLAGTPWPERIERARQRAALLVRRYPHLLPSPSTVGRGLDDVVDGAPPVMTADIPIVLPLTLRRFLTSLDAQADVNVDLLCRAADWFATHDATGLTPRQVPIEGLHAKWLNTRQHLVRAAAGLSDLGLLPDHPGRIHFTYLDPGHRAAGGRLHDSATMGDDVRPAYPPRVVIISENKDTALYFPPVPGGLSVEGAGRGGSMIASFEWITAAQQVVYWGDMDADGLEILDGFRAAGIAAKALFMDVSSYERYERYGTDVDKNNKPLTGRSPRRVDHLKDGERDLYLRLCDPGWKRYRRIEQERVPLQHASAGLASLIDLPECEAPNPFGRTRDGKRGRA